MPYVPQPLLAAAVDALKGKHVVAVLVIPSMVRAGVTVTARPEEGVPYGSSEETDVLRRFFSVPGSPPDKPFRAVWASDDDAHWRDTRYAGRSLQRVRTDQVKSGKGLRQVKRPGSRDLWSFTPDCGPALSGYIGAPVRTIDLAIWYGRDEKVESVEELLAWFLGEFPLGQDDLVGTIYSDEIPEHYFEFPLSPEPLTQDDYASTLGAAPAPAKVAASLSEFIERLETSIGATGFLLAPGLVKRIVTAWGRGDIVVLLGSPGTGKTRLAYELARSLGKELEDLTSVWVAVRTDFDESELVGYERLDGTQELRDFATKVIQSEDPLGTHLVVLEEFNLAQLENYMAQVLIATQDPDRRMTLPGGGLAHLPVDTLFLATCNSYLEEPETRIRMSYPAKRRSTIIPMPNILFQQVEAGGDGVAIDIAVDLIGQERARVEKRMSEGRATAWDPARLRALSTVTRSEHFSLEVREVLKKLVATLLSTPEGRDFFTMGLLRDIALAIAFAARSPSEELKALGEAIADKLVHQLRGPQIRGDAIVDVARNLPNGSEIELLIERMKSGMAGELTPIV